MRKTGYIDAKRLKVGSVPLEDLILAIKAKTDNLPSSPANETTSAAIKARTDLIPAAPAQEDTVNDVLDEVEVIEGHLHNLERFLGARPGWNGSDEVNAATNASLTDFRLDAGNDTWGTPLCILGSGDTPVQAGKSYFDLDEITVTAAERTTKYRFRFAWGTSYAAAISAGTFSETEFVPQGTGQDSGPTFKKIRRLPAGTKMFVAVWCYGANTGWIDFTIGLHEYNL